MPTVAHPNFPNQHVVVSAGALASWNALGWVNIADDAGTVTPSTSAINISDVIGLAVALAARSAGSHRARAMGDRTPLAADPTVTVNATSATTLTNTKFVSSVIANPFRVTGADTAVFATSYIAAVAQTNSTNGGARTVDLASPFSVAFDFDGAAFEADLNVNANVTFRVWANEQVSSIFIPGTGGITGRRTVKVDFGTRAQRRIILEFNPQAYFAGVYIAKTDSVVPPSSSANRKVAIVGDSYVAGQGAETSGVSMFGYAHRLVHLLGYLDYRDYGVSGTGFIKETGTTGTYGVKYLTRLADVVGYAPDDIIVQASINDNGLSGIPAAVTAYLNALTAALPLARVILVTPPQAPSSAAGTLTNATDVTTGKNAATSAAAIGLVDFANSGALTGTGKVGTPTSDGNGDFYASSISTGHPSLAGHEFIARRMASLIAPIWQTNL